jgi:hypothetical protein
MPYSFVERVVIELVTTVLSGRCRIGQAGALQSAEL